eukprot:scaffold1168_cov167-Amphora_coffeaeformis.AAC.33
MAAKVGVALIFGGASVSEARGTFFFVHAANALSSDADKAAKGSKLTAGQPDDNKPPNGDAEKVCRDSVVHCRWRKVEVLGTTFVNRCLLCESIGVPVTIRSCQQ